MEMGLYEKKRVSNGESRIPDLRRVRSTCHLLRHDNQYWLPSLNYSSLTLFPMKFCRSTLFEAGRALFVENWKIYLRTTSMVLTVNAVLKTIWRTRVSQNGCEVSCSLRFLAITWGKSIMIQQQWTFLFLLNKETFHLRMIYFTENHEIGSVVVRKVKKSWDSGQNRELGPAIGSRRAIFYCWSFHHVYCLDEWPWSCDSCEMYKISTS